MPGTRGCSNDLFGQFQLRGSEEDVFPENHCGRCRAGGSHGLLAVGPRRVRRPVFQERSGSGSVKFVGIQSARSAHRDHSAPSRSAPGRSAASCPATRQFAPRHSATACARHPDRPRCNTRDARGRAATIRYGSSGGSAAAAVQRPRLQQSLSFVRRLGLHVSAAQGSATDLQKVIAQSIPSGQRRKRGPHAGSLDVELRAQEHIQEP
jgi:hypothetical protein